MKIGKMEKAEGTESLSRSKKSNPRGYGGVAIIWRENIDHLIKILPDGTERIQCVEINSNNDTKFLVASVYLPSKGSHDCR